MNKANVNDGGELQPSTPQTAAEKTRTAAPPTTATAAETSETENAPTGMEENCVEQPCVTAPLDERRGQKAAAGETENRHAATETEQPDIADLLADAEQRGYLRGRNENIAQLMRRPGVFERMPDARSSAEHDAGSEIMVLTRERVSIWDK